MLRNNKSDRRAGFTLIEMVVIAPIALLVIAGFVAIMVTMVGDVIAGRAQNAMTYDVQSALTSIDQDVRLSTQFMTTSGTMSSPQGKDGATSAFTSTGTPGDLILGEIATDKNPIDPTRGFVYYNVPFSCSDPAQVYKNRTFFTTVMYFVQNGSLWKRTYVPTASGTLCQSPWQVNTCAPGYLSSATRCQTNDSEIMKNVKTFTVSYYTNPQDSTAISSASATTAKTINVYLEGETTAAGRTINTSSSGRSTKLSDKDVALAVPDSPVVTGSSSGNEAIFTWPAVSGATSYIVKYNINGGSWITATENSQDTSFSVAANRGDTVSAKVFARNTTGASADASSNNSSTTIPLWTPCILMNGWVDYGGGFDTCAYTVSKDGVVMFKGLIKDGSLSSNVILFQLPVNVRPSTRLMFQTLINPSAATRINVYDDGTVRLDAGTSASYLSLSGIYFIPENSLYSWTDIPLLNSWTAYSGSWPTLQSTKDGSGRVHLRGLIKQGTYTSGTPIAQLPAGQTVSEYYHYPARGDSYNLMAIDETGQIDARGISSAYYSIQAMFYPSTYGGWQSFTSSVAGNPADSQMGNNWVTYGSIYAVPQFTKSADGIVTLKGLIKSGTATDGTFMAKLPAGYRPSKTLVFSTAASPGAGRIDVNSSGYIIFRAGSNTWMSLAGISYMAEQ